jgi:DNA-binding SARP family transcriptional activator
VAGGWVTMGAVRFGILGPTQVRLADGRAVDLRGPRLRALLVLLLVGAGRIVSAQRLIDRIYGDDPPRGAANALQSQVSRLRQVLSGEDGQPAPVELHPAGYRLAVDRDLVLFGRLYHLGARTARCRADELRTQFGLTDAAGRSVKEAYARSSYGRCTTRGSGSRTSGCAGPGSTRHSCT